MNKDELIKALQGQLSIMEGWATEVSDEMIDGEGIRELYSSDLERSRELRGIVPTGESGK